MFDRTLFIAYESLCTRLASLRCCHVSQDIDKQQALANFQWNSGQGLLVLVKLRADVPLLTVVPFILV